MSSIACMACQDTDDPVVILPCGDHAYCTDCFHAAVRMAIKDESTYPLQCGSQQCEQISDKFVTDRLAEQGSVAQPLIVAFRTKAEEYKVPGKDRTYCANQDCVLKLGYSCYINENSSGSEGKVVCPECSGITCCSCKVSITGETTHHCEEPEYEKAVKQYMGSLPEDELWLWKKCYSCGRWTDKIQACNHMTCQCKAEFCLVCGRPWEGLINCSFGCPKSEAPIYDENGFNQNGFHRDTGLDHQGNPWKNDWEDNDDDGDGNDDDGWEEPIYGEDGFDQWDRDWAGYDRQGFDSDGFNRDGFDRDGFRSDGFNEAGFDRQGFDFMGFNAQGYGRDGFDRDGRDAKGFSRDGFDIKGFDAHGVSLRGLPRDAYDKEGYDTDGWDVHGFSRAGMDEEGYDHEGYSASGFDRSGYNRFGYQANGFDVEGYDRRGRDAAGFSRSGYNAHHRDAKGDLQHGYYVGSDGNVRKRLDEGPKASVMDCDHNTRFVRAGATCVVCHWEAPTFHRHCNTCGANLCRDCDNYGVERQRISLRHQYLWPGDDSFGLKEMFSRARATELLDED